VNIRFRFFLLVSALALVGCAPSREIYLPDGSVGYNIQCDGTANSISNCFQKAGELCRSKGYSLLNREGEMVPFGTSTGAQGANVTQAGAFVSRTLFIKCKQ